VAVRVEDLVEHKRPERLHIRATVFVEQESQKGILIGKGGTMLKRIGTDARRELEAFFGIPVFLGLTVSVRRNWRRDPRALREFGFLLTSGHGSRQVGGLGERVGGLRRSRPRGHL